MKMINLSSLLTNSIGCIVYQSIIKPWPDYFIHKILKRLTIVSVFYTVKNLFLSCERNLQLSKARKCLNIFRSSFLLNMNQSQFYEIIVCITFTVTLHRKTIKLTFSINVNEQCKQSI